MSGNAGRQSFRIDTKRHEVYIGDYEVPLAPKEYTLLVALTESGQTMSREALAKIVSPRKKLVDLRTIDQHVSRLRLKMHGVDVVKTVKTRGYKIA